MEKNYKLWSMCVILADVSFSHVSCSCSHSLKSPVHTMSPPAPPSPVSIK